MPGPDTRHLLLAFVLWSAAATGADDPATLVTRGDTAFGRGDVGEAIVLFREAAVQGHAPAQSRLAFVLDRAEENEEAVDWYRKAADQGDAQGQFGLGQMMAAGEGTQKDPVAGLVWIRRAADQGYLAAILTAARLLEAGEPKTLRNPQAAMDYWRRGAAQGDHGAIRRLMEVHRNGELGQPVNEAEAKVWEAKMPVDTSKPKTKRK